jgi:protoheme IX farnesyltransferase
MGERVLVTAADLTGVHAIEPVHRVGEFLTLTKPAITAFIVLVGVGGFFLADPSSIALAPLLLLVVFGGLASGGAAMMNHYFDRDLDAQMRRTRLRPLPAHRIEVSSALVGGLALSAVGIGGAVVLLNPLTGFAIFLGGATYVGLYTIVLKRRTSWNIVFGGFAGSAPALAGSAAAVGHFTLGAWALALVLFLWTPPHFWSLALLLRRDYDAAELPMLPKMDDPGYSGKIVLVSAALLVPATVFLWWAGPIPLWGGALLVALGALFVAVTAPLAISVTPARARRAFIYSGIYLLAFVATLIAASLLGHPAVGAGVLSH